MFAKLVTNVSGSISANVFFNTLINVITGSITSNTQLDPVTFIPAASYIVNTVPSNWTVVDSQANSSGTNWILPGCAPVVIASPWSDAANTLTQQKFLYVGPTNSVNTNLIIQSWPMEYYVSNSTGKFYYNSYNSNSNPATSLSTNTTSRSNTDIISFTTPNLSTNGTITIVSASPAHLLVVNYSSLTGAFNNYFFLSEYSRDDPWNTVGNGYPSWFFESNSNTSGWAASTTTAINAGGLTRTFNTLTNQENSWTPMWTGGATGTGNWGLSSRAVPYGQFGISLLNTGAYLPRGLSSAGQNQHFNGNQILAKDLNKQPAALLSEIRLINLAQGGVFNSNTMFAGGSVSAVNPYVYLFRSQYNTLDEFSVGSNTYMNLIMNTGTIGTTNASCVLVLEK